MLNEIALYLEAQGKGSVNTDIFLAELPDTKTINNETLNVDNCIALFNTGGFEPELYFVGENTEYPTFQVIVRDRSYAQAWQRIKDIYGLLHGNTALFPLTIAQQPPVPLGQDSKKRWEISVNFKATKQM